MNKEELPVMMYIHGFLSGANGNFCPRWDGVQTYTLTREVLDKYAKYDIEKEIKSKCDRMYALCSTADELIGDLHIKTLKPLLAPERLMIVDDFGHQRRDKGMDHLY